jgi:serine protease Do
VIGVNSFIIPGGDNLGFALPVNYLREALQMYLPNKGQASTRCFSCGYLVTATNIDSGKYCPSCGTEVKLPEIPEKETEAAGAAKTIEEILKELGKDVRLAREGINTWSVKEGLGEDQGSLTMQKIFLSPAMPISARCHRMQQRSNPVSILLKKTTG